jgi:succinoglycan biosynthesis transport protein ExoP
MLQLTKQPPISEREPDDFASLPLATTIATLLRRQYPTIAVVFIVSVGLGLLYLLTTPPSFTAQAMLVIDSRKMQVFEQQSVLGDYSVDSTTVETQVEILKSESIGLSVIKDLRLTRIPNSPPVVVGCSASSSSWCPGLSAAKIRTPSSS